MDPINWSSSGDTKAVEALIKLLLNHKSDQDDLRKKIFQDGNIYVLVGDAVLPLVQALKSRSVVKQKYTAAIMAIKTVETTGKYGAKRIDMSIGGWKDPSDHYDLNENVALLWPPLGSETMHLYRRFTKGTIEYENTKPFIRSLVINGENIYMGKHELAPITHPETAHCLSETKANTKIGIQVDLESRSNLVARVSLYHA